MNKFKLAMGQMHVEYSNAKSNLERAKEMIKDAGKAGCSIIVLPECLDLGWANPNASDLAKPIPGDFSNELCRAAHKAQIYVAAGLTEKSHDKVHNAAILISPEGEILLKHRKINILTDVEGMYSIGNSLGVVDTPLGVIGIDICADNFPDSLAIGHALARMGAQIILSPSAWAVDGDHDNLTDPYGSLWMEGYSALSKLYDISVVGVSNVGWVTEGPWKGRKCIGCSLAVGPGGNVLAQGQYGDAAERLILIDVEPKEPAARGTEIAPMLAGKGYVGP